MSSRINPRQRAIAESISADGSEYRASEARGLAAAIARLARPDYQAECEARAVRMSPFVRRALAHELPAHAIGGRS